MQKTVFAHTTVFSGGELLEDHAILVEGGKITKIAPSIELIQEATGFIDAQGDFLVPGFIDLHIHGMHSFLVDNGKEDVEQISRLLPRYGITGFLPTIIPHAPEVEDDYLKEVSIARSVGAQILGFFCEGPYLAKTGAIQPSALKDKSPERLEKIKSLLAPRKAIFAISPELEGLDELIPRMERPVFITHTQADVEQTERAIELGARHATHFYDVFAAPEQTDPGVRPSGAVEVILADPRVTVDFILDGEHVHPAAVRLAKACKPLSSISLISDSNIGAGFPPGTYQGFGSDEISFAYPGAPARGTENSHAPHALFGSGLTLDVAVKNVIKLKLGRLQEAIIMASTSPAKVLGIYGRKGDLNVGFDADIVRLSPQFEVQETWVSGKSVFKKGEA
jgi:N-acetylglucosamine-6-phosphate deacetylase